VVGNNRYKERSTEKVSVHPSLLKSPKMNFQVMDSRRKAEESPFNEVNHKLNTTQIIAFKSGEKRD
jgi:hypothetical protein